MVLPLYDDNTGRRLTPYVNYAHVHRIHEDDSLLWRYYQAPDQSISKMALSLTWDLGC